MIAETPIRRTLALIVRGDGAVRLMYTASRGDLITKRESWGLAQTDGEMAAIFAEHPVIGHLDFLLPRIQIGRRHSCEGVSSRLNDLVSKRIISERCIECGGKRDRDGEFCSCCMSAFPIRTDIGSADNAWQWAVVQVRPAWAGGAFAAMRIGVYEREGRTLLIGYFDTFGEAKTAAEKNYKRSSRMTAAYYGYDE